MTDKGQEQEVSHQVGTAQVERLSSVSNSRVQGLLVMAILLVFFSFPLVVWIYNSQYMRFVADDFCLANEARTNGLLPMVLAYYRNWVGRYSAVFFYGLVTQINYSSIWLLVTALLLTWFGAFVWVFSQAAALCRMNNPLSAGLSEAVVVLFCVFSASPAMMQPLYWLGSHITYMYPMVGLTLWVGAVLALAKREFSKPMRALLIACNFAIGFLLGGFPESYVVFQIVVLSLALLATMTLVSSAHKTKLASWLTAALVSSIAALVIQLSAPGTAVRQSVYATDITAVGKVVESLKFIPFGYSRFASVVLPSCFVFTILIAMAHLKDVKLPDPRLVVRAIAVIGVVSVVLLWVIKFPSIYIMWPYLPNPRLLLVSTTVSVITMVSWGVLVAMLIPRLSSSMRRVWRVALPALGLAALVVPIYDGLTSLKTTGVLQEFAQAWDTRQDIIYMERRSGNVDITLPPMPPDVYDLLQLDPISADPQSSSYWVNTCMAAYYGVNTILASENSSE